jgi:hypothetical protein
VGFLAIAGGSGASADDGNVADAVLPSHEKLTWGQEPLEIVSSRREQICLSGIWQFVPRTRRASPRTRRLGTMPTTDLTSSLVTLRIDIFGGEGDYCGLTKGWRGEG